MELEEARREAAELRLHFTKEVDASNRAVMAQTDEATARFAQDAEATLKLVENDLSALTVVLKSLGYPKEIQALDLFERSFAEYRKVDRDTLSLAVESTNLKAQRLAFGPGREAADGLRSSLASAQAGAASKDSAKLERLAGQAILAVREIQVLQGPHIAEADDAAMTRLESEMTALKTTAHAALTEFNGLVEPSARPHLAAAEAALERFDRISAEIVTLSRRNSNVRSLDLALRVKPPLAVACDASLRQLQDGLVNEGHPSAR